MEDGHGGIRLDDIEQPVPFAAADRLGPAQRGGLVVEAGHGSLIAQWFEICTGHATVPAWVFGITRGVKSSHRPPVWCTDRARDLSCGMSSENPAPARIVLTGIASRSAVFGRV